MPKYQIHFNIIVGETEIEADNITEAIEEVRNENEFPGDGAVDITTIINLETGDEEIDF